MPLRRPMPNPLVFLSRVDVLPYAVGLLVGIVVLILIRARQVWADRRAFGYSVYAADSLRQRLMRWAMIGAMFLLIFTSIYFWRTGFAAATAVQHSGPPPELTEESAEPFRFTIPSLGIDTTVIEAPIVDNQWDISTLTTEVAHLAGTAAPGSEGNSVLVGHITIPNAGWGPFQLLESLKPGDQVFVLRGLHEEHMYIVFDVQKVSPDNVEVTFPTDDTRLTLITCTTFDKVLNAYTERTVVSARLVDHP